MNASKNLNHCLSILIGLALNCDSKTIVIDKITHKNNMVDIVITRKFSINDLKKLNTYFKSDIRSKLVKYHLSIDFDEPRNISLIIENVKPEQMSIFDEDLHLSYNKKITDKLMLNYKLLLGLFEDNEINDWSFYYINDSHIGFANKDFTNRHCITFTTKANISYDNILKFTGTYAEALVKCLKRNINSSYKGNWKVCEFGSIELV